MEIHKQTVLVKQQLESEEKSDRDKQIQNKGEPEVSDYVSFMDIPLKQNKTFQSRNNSFSTGGARGPK